MATSKEYLEFIKDQLSELEGITYRSMMGEYIIYYQGRIAAYLCDDRLLIKPVPSAMERMPDASYEPPYEGAKDMLLCDDVDNRAFLKELFEAMYEELPAPKEKNPLKIKRLMKKDIPAALDLAWEVFLAFEAPEYSKEGIDEFHNFLRNKSEIESLRFYGAFDKGEIVGVLAMRSTQHVSLFFVKESHHRRGIGRKLFERMKKDYEKKEFSVNSSPYAVEIYRQLGFTETDNEQITNGIRYVPMKYAKEK